VRSERLPEGVLIGTITEYELNTERSAYSAKIAIAADMSKLDDVLIVENANYGEIEELMQQTN
jgi:rod shape-determining protein MreC